MYLTDTNMDDQGIILLPTGIRDDFLLQNVGIGCGAHPVGTSCSFPGVKWPEREAYRKHPSNAEVKNELSYIFVCSYSMVCTGTSPVL